MLACASEPPTEDDQAFDALSALPAANLFSAPDMGVFDTDKLLALESTGLSLHRVLGAPGPSAQQIGSVQPYKGIAEQLSAHIISDFGPDYRGIDYPLPRRWWEYGYRFNTKWLTSNLARFELVAVVQRLDKAYRTPGACGETRLIYRLAYTSTKNVVSRLPMTMNVVFINPQVADGSCKALATKWKQRTQADSAQVYKAGPLAGLVTPSRIEVNLQDGRSEDTNTPIIGGSFGYLLKAFDVSGAAPIEQFLENQPRPDLNASETAALQADISSHARDVDSGRYLMPSTLAAKSARVRVPGGMRMVTNRPFSAYIGQNSQLLTRLSLAGTTVASTAPTFARRLEQLSCSGCHATRSIGGFHVVGREVETTQSMASKEAILAVQVPVSNHFVDNVPFRRRALAALARGVAANESEPFAEHANSEPGKQGEHCGLGDAALRGWTCAAGLSCIAVNEDLVGQCHDATGVKYGQACLETALEFPSERLRYTSRIGANEAPFCNENGWPDGNRTYEFGRQTREYALGLGDATSIAGPSLRTTINRELFLSAGKFMRAISDGGNGVFIAGRCDASTPCRDSYTCARVPKAEKGNGMCVPPYFVPSLQIYGHDVN